MIVRNHHKDNIGVYIFILIVLILVVIAFTSCMTPSRSGKQVRRAAADYPGQTAAILRDLWPCDTTGTDTVLIPGDQSGFDAMVDILSNELTAVYSAQDSLRRVLESDTLCSQYAATVDSLRASTGKTKEKVIRLPVVPDTIRIETKIRDGADVAACEAREDKLLGMLANRDGDIKSLKKWRTAAWIMGAAWLLFIIGYVVRWLWGRK